MEEMNFAEKFFLLFSCQKNGQFFDQGYYRAHITLPLIIRKMNCYQPKTNGERVFDAVND
jgi:hypothetical protein